MKKFMRVFLLIVLLGVVLVPTTIGIADGGSVDKVVFGGSFTLQEDEAIDGNLIIFGGMVTLKDGSIVNKDVNLFGGMLTADGEIEGSVNAFGGTIKLGDNAVVHGDMNTFGVVLNKSDKTKILGNIISKGPGDINFSLSNPIQPFRFFDFVGGVFGTFFEIVFRTIAMAVLALLVVLFFEKPTRRVVETIVTNPFTAAGFGLLTIIVVPIIILLLTITLILIPVSLVSILALFVALLFGWFACGLEIGRRMEILFHKSWAPPVTALIGTLAISFLSSIIALIPCIGWFVPFIIAVVGLGGVVASRFGTQVYVRKLISSFPNSGSGYGLATGNGEQAPFQKTNAPSVTPDRDDSGDVISENFYQDYSQNKSDNGPENNNTPDANDQPPAPSGMR